MPIISQDYDGQSYNPAAPIVEIIITHPTKIGNQDRVMALIDSGADATMLPINILNKVGARFIETRQLRGRAGQQLVGDTYLVSIQLGPFNLHGIHAVALREGFEAVLGRDVLNQLIIVLNGPAHVTQIDS